MADSLPASDRPGEGPVPTEPPPVAEGAQSSTRDPNAPPRSGSRRRRGSRGGRGRSRSGAAGTNGGADTGAAGGEPTAVTPPPARPRIGDTRPAPAATTRSAPATATGGDGGL